MNAAHWGAVLKRTRLAHVFSDASGLSITLTICLPAEVHKHAHALTHMKKTYGAYARTEVRAYAHFFPTG